MLILTDVQVSDILQHLSFDEIRSCQKLLVAALTEYYKDEDVIPQRIVTTTPYATHLFMASTGSSVGMKALTSSKKGMQGLVTILDKTEGFPIGILNAYTLTAFRTALSTTLTLVKVFDPASTDSLGTLICYGVGAQALWHIRLALGLYPGKFAKVVVCNRTESKAAELADSLKSEFADMEFLACSDASEYYYDANVIFTCVPSISPTVHLSDLANSKRRLFIGAIGSYKPEMIEVEGDLIKKECLAKGGKVVVDSTKACLAEAGEFIQNGIRADSLLEIAAVYDQKETPEFIKSGKVVISKLVGLAIMDVSVGSWILEQAQKRNMGTFLEGL